MVHPIADVVNSVVEVVDIDGVVRRINIDDVVKRIDIDHVVSRIDIDNVVERIHIDHVVQRIDINALLGRISWNDHLSQINFDDILKRIDTKTIVARSSTGVFTLFLDAGRSQLVVLDLSLWILSRCRFWTAARRQACVLPPKANTHLRQRQDRRVYPRGRMRKAVAVQGRYCGFVSKAVAILMDVGTVTLTFALFFQVAAGCLMLFLGQSKQDATHTTDEFQQNQQMAMVLLYAIYWFGYFWLSVGLTGQTLGMVVVGLKVVNVARSSRHCRTHVSLGQAWLRTALLPVTLTVCPPLCILGIVRRDGRMLHDYGASTGMIYAWDAKAALVRDVVVRPTSSTSSSTSYGEDDEDEYDETDAWIGNQSSRDEQETFLESQEGLEVNLEGEPLLLSTTTGGASHDQRRRSSGVSKQQDSWLQLGKDNVYGSTDEIIKSSGNNLSQRQLSTRSEHSGDKPSGGGCHIV